MTTLVLAVLAQTLDLSSIDVSSFAIHAPTAATPAQVLREEWARRSGRTPPLATTRGPRQIQLRHDPKLAAEAFRLRVGQPTILEAATTRGYLYGIGALLRQLRFSAGRVSAPPGEIAASPAYPLRGHQLGYRATANSYDAWSVAQYDQYIRELALAGANAIENIPLQDNRAEPLMKVSRREMNRALSAICQKYGLEYWIWVPADFNLTDEAKRRAFLAQTEEVFADSPTLTGFFFPGGDPGHNPPELVWKLLEDLAPRLGAKHPAAKIWLSLQGFDAEKEETVYRQIEAQRPAWLGGLVAGPSSPPLARSRARLPQAYGLRLYPDITHNKLCQFQVPQWDQAFALTLGREGINPRAEHFTQIFHQIAPWSNGFVSYSDGVHDDVNKFVFTRLGWNPAQSPRAIAADYARLFFPEAEPERAADAILALERNWRASLASNGAVETTLAAWPRLGNSWRAQMLELRAVYDAYTRRRLLHETALEEEANAALRAGDLAGAQKALARTGVSPALRQRIEALCASLFQSIGLQTSVSKYGASGAERGAILDFVDYPLNNRYWLTDEFAKLAKLPDEAARRARMLELANWENPGPGSFYDDLGHVARSPRVRGDLEQDPAGFLGPEPTFWWLDQGQSRLRLSQQVTQWPRKVVYEALDPDGRYVLRTSGYGQHLPSADGVPLTALGSGERREFAIPAELLADRRLELTFTIPANEGHLNWRQRSRLAELWLVKLPN